MSELRVTFHRQMEDIERDVVGLFALVAEDLATAMEALLDGDFELTAALPGREAHIDALQVRIEEMTFNHLALQSPVAADLRFLLCVIRIVPELERSHDLVIHVANRADHTFSLQMGPRVRGIVQQMGSIAVQMWHEAGLAWSRDDTELANRLEEEDDALDTLHIALGNELLAGNLPIPVIIEMTLVGRFLERLGDHAVNIARRMIASGRPRRA